MEKGFTCESCEACESSEASCSYVACIEQAVSRMRWQSCLIAWTAASNSMPIKASKL